jgi:hypothetical protein
MRERLKLADLEARREPSGETQPTGAQAADEGPAEVSALGRVLVARGVHRG